MADDDLGLMADDSLGLRMPARWANFVRRRRAAQKAGDRQVMEQYAALCAAGLAPAEWAVDIRCNQGHPFFRMTLAPSESGSGWPLLWPAGPHKRKGQIVYDVATGPIADDTSVDYRLRFSCPEGTHERRTRFEVRYSTLLAEVIRAALAGRRHVQIADTPEAPPG